jgi:predicted DNA-binding transcriptional regulator AlpA
MPDPMPELVAPKVARAMCGGISESTLRRLIDDEKFPQPVVLSRTKKGKPARIAFVRSELAAWVARAIERGRPAA